MIGKVHFRVVTYADDWSAADECGIEAQSIAQLLTIAEGFTFYEHCMDILEEVLCVGWQSFQFLGDVTVTFFGSGIAIHTRHRADASQQIDIYINPAGHAIAAAYIGKSKWIYNTRTQSSEWKHWLTFISPMSTNQKGYTRIAPGYGGGVAFAV